VTLGPPNLPKSLGFVSTLFIPLGPVKEPMFQRIVCIHVDVLKLLCPLVPLPNLVSNHARLPNCAVLVALFAELVSVVDTLVLINWFWWCWEGVVLAGAFRGPANIAGECKCAELASGVFAVIVGEGAATVVCVHWVVAVANEVKDVFGVGVLGGGDSNGNGRDERHYRGITCQ